MTPAEETLTQFRAEISAELERLEAELATAREAASEADKAYRAAAEHWREVRDLFARKLPKPRDVTEGISGPLYDRLEGGRRDALREPSNILGRANSRVKSIESSIENRRLAIRQIDAALGTTTQATVHEIGTRRTKAEKPIDFDTISIPHEVVSNGAR